MEMRDVVLHGHRLVYRFGGDELGAERPVLLLIHGLGGSSATWQEVLPAFARRHTVVAPDLLGHGESDKPSHDYSLGAHANVLRDLMIAIGFERATVVGQSLGGGVALQLAYQHPQRCERLVLVSSGGLGSEVSWLLRALTLPGVEYLMPMLFPSFVRDAGNALSRRLRGLGVRAPRLEQEWRTYVSLTEPGNRSSFMRTLRSVVDPTGQTVSANDRLYLTSQVPTLILWGRHDRMIPVEHAFAAHEAIPQSQLVIFEDSGHFPQAEEPQRFFEVVSDFVDTTEPGRSSEAEYAQRLAPTLTER
jgi:pimeloyl-ACP methyl ester carboxylesterase